MRPCPLVLAAALWPALAEAAPRPLQAELPPGRKACFERVYDAAHLKAHPQQRVTRLRLVHLPDMWTPLDDGRFFVMLFLDVRDKPSDEPFAYQLSGFCRPAGQGLRCDPEWDAGSWRIERGPGGALDVVNGDIVPNPNPYDAEERADGAIEVKARPDDGRWRLRRMPDDACAMP